MAIGRDLGHLVEAGVAQHAHHQVAACVHAAIFGGDGGLANPVLQPLDGFVVALGDLRFERFQIGVFDGAGASGRSQRGRGHGALQEQTAIEVGHSLLIMRTAPGKCKFHHVLSGTKKPANGHVLVRACCDYMRDLKYEKADSFEHSGRCVMYWFGARRNRG